MGVGRSCIVAAFVVVVVAVLCLPSSASAERTRVDWKRGLFIGRGIAVGDLRSPSRQLARVKAERQAKAQCRALLLDGVKSLRWAHGKGDASTLPEGDALERLGESIFTVNTDFGTDGSVVVEMALPLEALRSMVDGPDTILAGPGEGPGALVVDARALGLKPAIGYTLSDGTTTYAGPTLFFESEASARLHAGIGKEAPLLAARATPAKLRRAGVIPIEAGALLPLLASRPLIAILWKAAK